jgi:hypothetical protein
LLRELEGEGAHPNERRDDSEGVIRKRIVEIWVKNGLRSIRQACRQLASRAIVNRGRRRGGRVIKRSLSRDIGAALAFKAVALTLIYLLFFSGSRAPVVTPTEMAGFLTDCRGELRH